MNQLDQPCGKEAALVGYLYDEISVAERRDFDQHLQHCQSCKTELQAFRGVRDDLQLWELPYVPPIEIVTPRTAMDALRELVQLVPNWLKLTAGFSAAGAAAVLLLTLSQAQFGYDKDGFFARFGQSASQQLATGQVVLSQPATAQNLPANYVSREEVAALIQSAVTQAQQQSAAQAQLQFAALETRLANLHQVQLKNVTMKLTKQHQNNVRELMAEGNRQTLTEWLFAAGDSQERTENERNN